MAFKSVLSALRSRKDYVTVISCQKCSTYRQRKDTDMLTQMDASFSSSAMQIIASNVVR